MPPRGPVRARDLRRNIKEFGFERGTVITLELLLDEFTTVRSALVELTNLQAALIDRFTEMTQVGDGMQRRIDALRRQETQHESARGSGIVPDGDA